MDSAILKGSSEKIFKKINEISGCQPEKLRIPIFEMRDSLTSKRGRLLSGYMNRDESLFAYLNYHLPVHLPEAFWIFEQNRARLKEVPSIAEFAPEGAGRVLDLGCGPGTASLSLLLWLQANHIDLPKDFELVDLSQKALGMADALIKTVGGDALNVRRLRGNLIEGVRKIRGPFEWVIMSHVLNEFGNGPRLREKKAEILQMIARKQLAPGSKLLIIEPPLREPTMDLMWIRDQIRAGDVPGLEIIGPCPQQADLCPLLFEAKGWCYAQPYRKTMRALGMAPWDQRLERMLHTELSQPGFSYLLLKLTDNDKDVLKDDGHAIALSDSGTKPAWLCSKGRNVRFGEVANPHRGAYVEAGFKDHTSRTAGLHNFVRESLKPVEKKVIPRRKKYGQSLGKKKKPSSGSKKS